MVKIHQALFSLCQLQWLGMCILYYFKRWSCHDLCSKHTTCWYMILENRVHYCPGWLGLGGIGMYDTSFHLPRTPLSLLLYVCCCKTTHRMRRGSRTYIKAGNTTIYIHGWAWNMCGTTQNSSKGLSQIVCWRDGTLIPLTAKNLYIMKKVIFLEGLN